MNAIKCSVLLLFVILATGVVAKERRQLNDPWCEVRDYCRKQCGLTEKNVMKAEKHLQKIKTYITCMGDRLGNINEDGTVNRDGVIKSTVATIPLIISEPMTDCCIDRVYKGKQPSPHEVEGLFTDFVTCIKDFLPRSIWNLVGTLRPPVYHRLKKCLSC